MESNRPRDLRANLMWVREAAPDLRACHRLTMLAPADEADAGFVIMEQVEYPGMSGTNIICVATVLLETGMLPMLEPVTELTLESPAGLIRVRAECANGKVQRVTFQNVPAFAAYLDARIEVPHLGSVTVDVAYGGMFYVIAEAAPFGLRLTPDEGRDIVRISEMIKAAAQEQLPVVHPEQPGFAGITIAELSAPPTHPGARMKNAVTVSTGELDWNRPATWTRDSHHLEGGLPRYGSSPKLQFDLPIHHHKRRMCSKTRDSSAD